jgi:hypothetical protein
MDNLIIKNEKNIKRIFVIGLTLLFLLSIIWVISAYFINFKISTLYLLIIIICLSIREFIIHLFNSTIKKVFPTDKLPKKIKSPLDKLFSWCIIVFQLGIGINIFPNLIALKPITSFQQNIYIIVIFCCFIITYILGVLFGMVYVHYSEEYKKLKKVF